MGATLAPRAGRARHAKRGNYRAVIGTAVAVSLALATTLVLINAVSAGAQPAASAHLSQVVASVDGGNAHSCAVQTTGVVSCWGRNDLGQATPPAGTFTDVRAGGSFTCGIRTDGTIACWGKNDVGQATPPVGTFRQLTVGNAHACAVKTDGSEACWGSNAFAQSTAHPGLTYRQVTAGDRHTCGLRSDGLVPCWGDDSQGQATSQSTNFVQISAGAMHTCGVQGNGTVACWGDNTSGQSTPPVGTTFREVSSGGQHTCGLTTVSTIVCWGSNANGQRTPPAGTFTAVTAGVSHSCAVRTSGAAVCWGLNTDTQSTAKAGVYNSRALDAGFFETCGIRTDGVVACWGDNSFGQSSPPTGTFWQISTGVGFSCGIRTDSTIGCWGSGYPGSPVPVPPSGSFKQVRVSAAGGVGGHEFACAIRSSGAPTCWGDPLGAVSAPVTQVFDLGVGQTHACAVMTGGSLTCWGDNSQGQTTKPFTGAYLAVSGEDYTNGSAFTSCALRVDGAILCWGSNSAGQAGPAAGPYTEFDLGSWFGCGVKGDGTVACWGQNTSGEATPPAGGFQAVTTGDAHACGAKVDGNITCWGANDSGELGGTPPHFTNAAPPGGVIGQPYTHSYTASGLATNAYTLKSGTLPTGLSLNPSTGLLAGTPTKAGTFTGSVGVTNGFFFPDATQSFTITVLPVRTVTVADREAKEGSSGSAALAIPVTISAPVPSGQTASVVVSTQDDTAIAGSDYTAVSTTLTWVPGDPLTKNVNVSVTGDTRKEGTERFRVNLSSFVNVVAADTSGYATILDDDGSFYISVADAAVAEGNAGTALAQFAVTLSAAPATGQSVSVRVATVDGTAIAGSDYTALATTTLTWVPGTALTQYVKVTVTGDTVVEPAETFRLNLSSPSAFTQLSDTSAEATITNDD